MKEASGEANLTIVALILIGIVLAIGTVIITNFMNSTSQRTDCTEQGLCYNSATGQCQACN